MQIVFGADVTEFDRVHQWLSGTYWSPGIPREKVEKAARNSALVVNAIEEGRQVGYARVVSDRTSFAWVCDVFVEQTHRGKGIARAMVSAALKHPEFQGFRRWVLATQDAHGVYAGLGFQPLPSPDRWMAYFPTNPTF